MQSLRLLHLSVNLILIYKKNLNKDLRPAVIFRVMLNDAL